MTFACTTHVHSRTNTHTYQVPSVVRSKTVFGLIRLLCPPVHISFSPSLFFTYTHAQGRSTQMQHYRKLKSILGICWHQEGCSIFGEQTRIALPPSLSLSLSLSLQRLTLALQRLQKAKLIKLTVYQKENATDN